MTHQAQDGPPRGLAPFFLALRRAPMSRPFSVFSVLKPAPLSRLLELQRSRRRACRRFVVRSRAPLPPPPCPPPASRLATRPQSNREPAPRRGNRRPSRARRAGRDLPPPLQRDRSLPGRPAPPVPNRNLWSVRAPC